MPSKEVKSITKGMPPLTHRQLRVLALMNLADKRGEDYDAEIVVEDFFCYLGDERIGRQTVLALLRHCALKDVSLDTSGDGVQRYVINETGREILEG